MNSKQRRQTRRQVRRFVDRAIASATAAHKAARREMHAAVVDDLRDVQQTLERIRKATAGK